MDDSRVTKVQNERSVVNRAAYVLFYKRRTDTGAPPLDTASISADPHTFSPPGPAHVTEECDLDLDNSEEEEELVFHPSSSLPLSGGTNLSSRFANIEGDYSTREYGASGYEAGAYEAGGYGAAAYGAGVGSDNESNCAEPSSPPDLEIDEGVYNSDSEILAEGYNSHNSHNSNDDDDGNSYYPITENLGYTNMDDVD